MSQFAEKKPEIVKEYARNPQDTGSPEVQVALITGRMEELSKHLELHPKDNHSRRGLLKMVGRRRSLLDYLKKIDEKTYNGLIGKLGIRK